MADPIPWHSYVAIGDSLTEGLQDLDAAGEPIGWADRLAQHLADRAGRPVQYANLAIRGRPLRPILDEQVEPALSLKPDLVSIWGGGNDLLRPDVNPDAMAAAVEAAVRRFTAAGADVIVGVGVDPRDSPIIGLTRKNAALYVLALHGVVRRTGAHLLNCWDLACLRDWRMWHEDRLHFNTEGHQRVAQAALVALGLEPDRPDWDAPLPPPAPMTRRERFDWNLTWARDWAMPWVSRRIRRTSSGAGRAGKQPTYREVLPQG